MSILRRFCRRLHSGGSEYEPLTNCTEDGDEDGNGKQRSGTSYSIKDKCFDDHEEERRELYRALSCERHFVRRHGVCESEIQEDIRTLKQTMFEHAVKSSNLM